MYKEHKSLDSVGDRVDLWKFMDLPKFLNLLNGKLYFNRIDNFEDIYEGTYPAFNSIHRDKLYTEGEKVPEEVYNAIMDLAKKSLFVSCFHNSKCETAFMWKIYGKDDGIAIKTTSKRLKEALICKEDVYLSKVNYIDYEREFMPEGNLVLRQYLAQNKMSSFAS